MFNLNFILLLIVLLFIVLVFALSTLLRQILGDKRRQVLKRLQSRYFAQTSGVEEEEDILNQPFMERTFGYLARSLVKGLGDITPMKIQQRIEEKLEQAGHPRNLKAGEFLALQSITAFVVAFCSYFYESLILNASPFQTNVIALTMTILAAYLPWFALSKAAAQRQSEVRRRLPEIMDMMVVSVEAGLAFDLALARVVERFRGTIAEEFRRALREMNLGKSRKDALRDVAQRVNLPELSSLVNAVIQSDQLGVGIGDVLRLQADLIREKRQQWIEEQAMKAPIKLLFPLVFLIFPSIFIVILGPSLISIKKVLGAG